MGATLSLYLSRSFGRVALQIIALTFVLLTVIDFVEGARRMGALQGYSPLLGLAMSLLRTPGTLQFIIPFIILFAVIIFLLGMNKRREFVILRGAGLSTLLFLTPVLAISLLLGVLTITMLNPIAVMGVATAADIEAGLRGDKTRAVDSLPVPWFTQTAEDGYFAIGARRQSEQGLLLEGAIFIHVGQDGAIKERFDADTARLQAGRWDLTKVTRIDADKKPESLDTLSIPSSLNPDFVKVSGLSIDEWGLYDLPYAIDVARQAGRSPAALETRFYALLGLPLLLVGMALIAAPLTLRFRRTGPMAIAIFMGVAVGFLTYVSTTVVQALGSAGIIEPMLAAWLPIGATLLTGFLWVLFEEAV